MAKILMVDDDSISLMVTSHYLDDAGYEYQTANSGLEAFEKFKIEAFSVIFMNVEMHGLDGYQTTRKIREYERNNDLLPIKIIALTANNLIDDRLKCIEAGMNDHVSKPLNNEKLDNILSKLLCAS